MGGTGNKALVFGLLGAVGCLLGWLVGEGYLAAEEAARPAPDAAPSLISSLKVPSREADPPPDEFRKRLDAAKAQTGDIQISLIWDDKSDLDLYCVAPSGEVGRAAPKTGGGHLDVQTNRDGDDPPAGSVENIYWPKGTAPPGKYEVYVGFTKQAPKGAATVEYRVTVLMGTKRTEISKKITWQPGFSRGPKDPVFAFEVKSGVELYAPGEVPVVRGQKLLVPVVVRREFFQGTVEVKAAKESLPGGVSIEPVVIPADRDGGELILEATKDAPVGTTQLVLEVTRATPGGGRELLVTTKSDLSVAKPPVKFTLWALVSAGIWTAFLAVGLALLLVVGQNKQQGRRPFAPGPTPVALVALGAAGAGLLTGAIGQAASLLLLMADASARSALLGFVPGWMMLGALLGRGAGLVIPNVATKKAMLAGAVVGLFGALALWGVSDVREWIGRFAGAGVLGLGLGITVGAVGSAGRRAPPLPMPLPTATRPQPAPVKPQPAAKPQPAPAAPHQPMPLPTSGAELVGRPPSAPPMPLAPPPVAKPQAPPVAMPQAPPVAKPQALPPVAKPQAPAASADFDDGLPMPMGPPPPPRPTAASILDDGLSGPAPKVTKPPAPAAKPQAAPAVPAPTKPPAAPPVPTKPQAAVAPPKPPLPAPPKPPTAAAPKVTDADACPSCGRKIAGTPGNRYCMVCDKKF